MGRFRFVFFALSLIAAACLTSGCGARFIHAKTLEVTDALGLNPSNDIVNLVRGGDDLPADQQGKARELRDMSTAFYADKEKDLSIYGDLNGQFTILMLAVSQNSPGSTYPTPTEFEILTSMPHSKGERTSNGHAEIRFGSGGPVFTTDKPSDTLFEIEISDIYQESGDWIASGSFSMIAKNKDDNADTRRLFVMDGAFITKVKNH